MQTRLTRRSKDRLTKEINYWDMRAQELKAREAAGRFNVTLNSRRAQERVDELQARLGRRMEELDKERQISAAPPHVMGGAIVIPAGLIARLRGETPADGGASADGRRKVERAAMQAVMTAELRLGREPEDVSDEKRGYDIESRVAGNGKLVFLEVKGRAVDARTVTVSRNEILTALNKPDDFVLAVVQVDGDHVDEPRYVRQPFSREPDFGVTSVNYDLGELIERSEVPA